MLYDYVAKFETDIYISPFSSELADMLSKLDVEVPTVKTTLDTKMNVTAGSLITEEDKPKLCKIQNEEYKKNFENKDFQNKIGKTIKVGQTRFVGYESITEHKEGVITSDSTRF